MSRYPIIAPANECPDRRWSGVENVDAILFDDLPEAIGLWPVRRAFIHNGRRSIGQRTINNVTVAGDPADIGGAPKNIFIANVEDVLGGRVNADQITAGGVQDSLRFPGGAARIEKVERMLAIERRRPAVCIDILQFPMPPDIAAFFHVDVVSGTSKNDHAFDRRATAQRVINIFL